MHFSLIFSQINKQTTVVKVCYKVLSIVQREKTKQKRLFEHFFF